MDETPHDATEESLCCFLFTIYAGRVAYCTLYPVFGRELGLACKGVWFGCDGVDPLMDGALKCLPWFLGEEMVFSPAKVKYKSFE